MRGRLIDAGLLLGLILAAGSIVVMMLSLGRSVGPSRPAPDSVSGVTVARDAVGVVPVVPDAEPGVASTADASVTAEDVAGGGDEAAEAAASAGAEDANAVAGRNGSTGAADDVSEDDDRSDGSGNDGSTLDPAARAPAGSVPLDRIGFSFATGSSGACGVELEAWRHVAVSRELLAAYGCGAEVIVTFDDGVADRESVTLIVADTMNASWSRTVNVVVSPDEPALEYGLRTGTITPAAR